MPLERYARTDDAPGLDVSALYAEYWSPIVGYFRNRHFGGSIHECEDLASRVFERVLRASDRYADDGRVSSLLFTVAARIWLDFVKVRSRRPPLLPLVPTTEDIDGVWEIDPANPYADLEDAEADDQAVTAILAPLLPEQRAIVELRAIHGLSMSATGASLGISGESAKQRYYRAIAQLRKHQERAS